MMLKADFHTHTTYCDGKNTPAEMVKAAYDMGFTDFGISGHGDYSPAEPGFGMTDSFEINTGAISRGYRTAPYPNPILLKELHAMRGRIIINSDSHAANTIGYHFDQAVKVARSCGFDRTLILKPGGGFREIYLP